MIANNVQFDIGNIGRDGLIARRVGPQQLFNRADLKPSRFRHARFGG